MSPVATSKFRSTRPVAAIFDEAAWLMELLQIWQALRKDLFASYRPELHYMRGPGPKWQAKHALLVQSGRCPRLNSPKRAGTPKAMRNLLPACSDRRDIAQITAIYATEGVS
jgi:hypothetical protein